MVRSRAAVGLAWRAARDLVKQRVRARSVVPSDGEPRRGGRGQRVVEPQVLLMQNEFRLEPIKNAAKLIAVHLDMNSADRRARRHDAEIAQQLLDRIVRKEHNPIVRSDAAAL